MTFEENEKRRNDEKVKYIKDKICDRSCGKEYVFISYKSDDWELVLTDIVYRLVKDHGLNVYFDGSFDFHNEVWYKQFPENMGSEKCKGVIAFFDDKYATSYATLMELLYSQHLDASNGVDEGLPIVPIDLDRLTPITGEEWRRDTGLGEKNNVNAEREKEFFNDVYEHLVSRKILDYKVTLWKPGKRLTAGYCSRIVRAIREYKEINDNRYVKGMELDDIVKTIKNACGKEVFSSVINAEEKKDGLNKQLNYDKKDYSEQVKNEEYNTKPACVQNEVDVVNGDIKISYNATIAEIRDAFSKADTAMEFKSIREMMSEERGGKSYMDYIMAAVLGGCNNVNVKSPIYQVNYYLYDIANGTKENESLGATWTWSSNCRRTVLGLGGSGQIPDDYNKYFNNLPTEMRLVDIGRMFCEGKDDQFKVKKKNLIFTALNRLSDFMYKQKNGKKGLQEIL